MGILVSNLTNRSVKGKAGVAITAATLASLAAYAAKKKALERQKRNMVKNESESIFSYKFL